MIPKNPFRKKSEDDARAEVDLIKSLEKDMQSVVVNAQACLEDPKFLRYKDDLGRCLAKCEKFLMDFNISYGSTMTVPVVDPVDFGIVARVVLTEMNCLRRLLSLVSKDAKK